MTPLSLVLVAALAAVHLFSRRMRFLSASPRSRWLSVAGGISVAYVFVHLLPDLAEEQETVREATGETFTFLEYHVYLVALLGLATFYGLERAAKVSRGPPTMTESVPASAPATPPLTGASSARTPRGARPSATSRATRAPVVERST